MVRFASLIRKKTGSLFGVDISTTRVKMLELDGDASGLRILSYASEPLAQGAVAGHEVVDAEALAATIARALERTGRRTRSAAIAVSGPAVISKIIDMPRGMSDAELNEQIHFDAARHIPHPIDEVNLDFQVVEPHPSNDALNRVLLVACRRDNIEMRVAALEMAGMRVRLVDVEEYALQNACRLLTAQNPAIGDDASVAVFDIGAQDTRLTVQRNGRSYTREIAFGGQSIAEQLIQRHDLATLDRLQAWLASGDLKAAMIADEVETFAEQLAVQIERSLQFYASAAAADNEAIDQVIVVGGPTRYPGLDAALREHIGRPLALGNPLAGMMASAGARRNRVDRDAPSLMVAAGLALRGLE